jgi:hypothetical protein
MASTRYRDWDGVVRQVTANGPTKGRASAALKERLADHEERLQT